MCIRDRARGDQIYFITGRTAGDKDGVTPVLQKAFNIKDMHPVEFMGGRKLPTKDVYKRQSLCLMMIKLP